MSVGGVEWTGGMLGKREKYHFIRLKRRSAFRNDSRPLSLFFPLNLSSAVPWMTTVTYSACKVRISATAYSNFKSVTHWNVFRQLYNAKAHLRLISSPGTFRFNFPASRLHPVSFSPPPKYGDEGAVDCRKRVSAVSLTDTHSSAWRWFHWRQFWILNWPIKASKWQLCFNEIITLILEVRWIAAVHFMSLVQLWSAKAI